MMDFTITWASGLRSHGHMALDFGSTDFTIACAPGRPRGAVSQVLDGRVGGHRRGSPRYSYNAGSHGAAALRQD